ncbi:MAG: DUF4037 domain-containing protein [Spirochaetia bacterium]|jgi:hypothetical protein
MSETASFIPGLPLGRAFYLRAAREIIESVIPPDSYAAAFMGSGSDVLGYDSERSIDHHWGPRFQVFLPEDVHARAAASLDEALRHRLPESFQGIPVGYPDDDGHGGGVPSMQSGLAHHLIDITTVREFFARYLGMDIHGAIGPRDWLTFPEQRLLELTSGEVFHDPRGELARMRAVLAEYPRDVWLYRMACQWQRLSRQDAFIGRCAEAGDPLGMRIVAGRIVRDAMKLCFLVERTYAPYDKWLGSAFAKLHCAAAVTPRLFGALEGRSLAALEENLLPLYQALGCMHNALGVTGPLDVTPRQAFDRPYMVIGAERFTNALLSAIEGEELRGISVRIGAIDQYADSTDFIENVQMYRKSLGLYR